MKPAAVALGSRLAKVPWVRTLGVRPNLEDYPDEERALIRDAEAIYYPTIHYASLFCAQGKRIFPSLTCHLLLGDKIKQTTLFRLQGVPHPRTRFYYHSQRQNILAEFDYPFVAKTPRNSGRGEGVFLIEGEADLERYLAAHPVAYIQDFLSGARILRVVAINFQPVAAYWRRPPPGQWRANVHAGATISFENVPEAALDLAARTARDCDLDEVGLDLALSAGRWHVLEANMKYGWIGLHMAGVNPARVVGDLILSGQI
jgi:ribosomal protein S6--L-glutamate ligase